MSYALYFLPTRFTQGLRPVAFPTLPHLCMAKIHSEQGGQGTPGFKRRVWKPAWFG